MSSLPVTRPTRQGAESPNSWTKVDNRIKARKDLTGTTKLIYATIIDAMRETGTVSIGQRRLGDLVGACQRTVIRSVQSLVEVGLLVAKWGQSGERTMYQLPRKRVTKGHRSRKQEGDKKSSLSGQNVIASDDKKSARKEQTSSDCKSLRTDSYASPPKKRKRNPLWDAVCETFHLKPVTRTECTRVGKIVAEMKQHHATVEEVRHHAKLYRSEWPAMPCTPEAVLKHWDRFNSRAPLASIRADYAENRRAMEAAKVDVELNSRRVAIAQQILDSADSADVQAAYDAFLAEQPAGRIRAFYKRTGTEQCRTFLAERLAPGKIDEMLANERAPPATEAPL